MANLTPSGGNADLAGKTVVTLDGYEVTYDSNGYVRQSLSPGGEVKYYDSLGNQTSVPPELRVSPAEDPTAPVLPVSTQMPITDTIPENSIGASNTTTDNTQYYQAPTPDPTADEVETIPKPVPSSALGDLQAASNTEDIANFGTSAPPVSLESDAVLAARNASNTDVTDFLGSPKPVIGDGVVDAQLASNTDSEAFLTGSNFGTTQGDPAAITEFAARQQAFTQQAQQQQTIAQQRKQINNGDWRVRLRLAPSANYLYNAPAPGILQPLKFTDGILFPYTPQIDTSYKANYDPYDLTHSNYRGYFYRNSYVDVINLRCQFTAQDTNEANYLLAVIHFLKSATKMFYGQDAQRGAPPPLVYLTGLGQFQFNEHSCLIQQFNYSLPADVDYIRSGSVGNTGLNLTTRRDRQSTVINSGYAALDRLANAFLSKGAITNPFAPPTLGQDRPTYVPTKMEISINLLPIQSRAQVSKQFSVKEFANGNLLKGGFW